VRLAELVEAGGELVGVAPGAPVAAAEAGHDRARARQVGQDAAVEGALTL
jgi:hypothetical protein